MFIEPDGSVTFADLAAGVVPIAQALNPGQTLACDLHREEPAVIEAPSGSGRIASLRDGFRKIVNRFTSARPDDTQSETIQPALQTQQRALDDLHRRIEEQQALIDKLRAEAAQTAERQTGADERTRQTALREMFRAVQQVAVQGATFRYAIESGADIRAADLLPLIAQVEAYLKLCGFECIGEAGGGGVYDPVRHQVTAKNAKIQPGDDVYVRYVGYSYNGEILVKAQVAPLLLSKGQ